MKSLKIMVHNIYKRYREGTGFLANYTW